MAGERRGGLEITSSKTAPGGTPARPPGEVIFDLVFSNESLWSTVDPHGAQTIVEKSIEVKGVVDLGDLIREFIDRKTKPDLARGTVLAFAMELARTGVALRLPAELQSLDRAARQKLVDVFRSGQKGADEPTKTMAQPSANSGPNRPAPSGTRPPPQRTSSGSAAPSPPPRASTPPSRASTPPAPRPEEALDGWGKGLGAVAGASSSPPQASRSSGRTGEFSNPNRAAPGETSGPNKPPRIPTDPGRERSRTNIERPRPKEGLAIGAMFGPGRIAALSFSAIFLLIGALVGPRGSDVVPDDPLPAEIPCVRVEKNGQHAFCIVNLETVPPRLTLDDIEARKAKMLEAARRRGLVSVTFYNPDLTRWDPVPAPMRVQAQVARRPDDDERGEDAPRPSGQMRPASDDEGEATETREENSEGAQEVYVPRDQRPDADRKSDDDDDVR